MTARAGATKAQIKRAIQAAQSAGLYVIGIRPDGTVLTSTEKPLRENIHFDLDTAHRAAEAKKWGDDH